MAHAVIGADEVTDRARHLGLRDDDLADLRTATRALTAADRAEVDHWSTRLARGVGDLAGRNRAAVWDTLRSDDGLLPILALIDSAPAVMAYHRSRGVPEDVSAATLADLGEQIWVHRQTFGRFGLHTHAWLLTVWSGALYALGRLHFELCPAPDDAGGWALSVHIPEAGRLSPEAVDDAFDRARSFFPAHFSDHPVRGFVCRSWLLDPDLPRLLPGSNLAAFQQRWELTGAGQAGDIDTLFFVFHRRGTVDPDDLPTTTRLQRVTVDRLRRGLSWSIHDGRIAW